MIACCKVLGVSMLCEDSTEGLVSQVYYYPIFCTNSKIQAKSEVAQFRVFELDMEGPHSYRDVSPTV